MIAIFFDPYLSIGPGFIQKEPYLGFYQHDALEINYLLSFGNLADFI